jgi:hypothetical protein
VNAMNDNARSITEHELHDVLGGRATGLEPGPVPSDDILAGARRRTAGRRAVSVTAAVLATAGITAGVVATNGSGGTPGAVSPGPVIGVTSKPAPRVSPSPSSSATKPAGHVPTVTQQVGLAPGQTADKSAYDPLGTVVVLSGTVDGVPWQLQALRVVDPSANDPYWAGMVMRLPAGKHLY